MAAGSATARPRRPPSGGAEDRGGRRASEAAAPLPAPDRAFTAAAQGYWVQLGAFRARDGAEQFQRRVADELAWLSPLLAIYGEQQLYRLQAGPYPTRTEAQDVAGRVREALKLVPVVLERR